MEPNAEEITLSDQERDELIERVESNRLSDGDRQLLVKLIRCFFWVTFSLRETKISVQRLKKALFGGGGARRGGHRDDPGSDDPGSGDGPTPPATTAEAPPPPDEEPSTEAVSDDPPPPPEKPPRPGHGRRGSQGYPGAKTVMCCHEQLKAGERCPRCGRGHLYELPSGVEIRFDGEALLTAVRYEVEKLRCSGCGAIFTAPLPEQAGTQKYSARARAVLALSRYYLGLPWYRLEAFQSLVGMPVSDATQWDQVERLVGDVYPVYNVLYREAAQSEVFFQDDTTVRVLALLEENQSRRTQAQAGQSKERLGMHTTVLVCVQGERQIVLYLSGRAHAGENLTALLTERDPGREKPLVMSDALSCNTLADENQVIRCNCLEHACRQCKDIAEHFPQPCQRVIDDLSAVFAHEAQVRAQGLSGQARLAYHQRHSEPILRALKRWLEQQQADRWVEPNSSLGKAYQYLLKRWEALTRFLTVADAPLENNTAERLLKLMIRQRNNSLFFASAYSARAGDVLTSLIATATEAGINVLDYLVALQDNATAVLARPEQWLPWNYTEALA